MLRIRQDQVEIFERQVIEAHLDELVAHVQEFSPRLSAVLGPSRVRVAVSELVARAQRDGFLCRGPIQFYVDMGLLFGSGFSSDPQYPWVRATLIAERSPHELDTAMRLYQKAVVALNAIHGSGNAYTWAALERLLGLSTAAPELHGRELRPALRDALYAVHPEKVAFVGETALDQLIEKAIATTADLGFSTFRQTLLVTALVFAFGHDCLADPLYPWIGHTIRHEGIKTADKRAERLERRALIWLRKVLSST